MNLFSIKYLTKRRAIVLLIVFSCLLLAWVLFRSDEPTYHGRSLSSWIDIYRSELPGSAKRQRAEYAINQIGTNGLPCVLKWITNEPPRWKSKLAFETLPWLATATNKLVRDQFWDKPTQDRGFAGLQALGGNARSILPLLKNLADSRAIIKRQDYEIKVPEKNSWVGCRALACIGQEGLPKLLDLAMEADSPPIDVFARDAISEMGTNAFPAILTLTNCLQDPDPAWRAWAATVIGNCGEHARPFAQVLEAVLIDSDRSVSDAATNALRKVAPELIK